MPYSRHARQLEQLRVPAPNPNNLVSSLVDKCLALQTQNRELLAENGELNQIVKQQRYLRVGLYRTILALTERLAGYDEAYAETHTRYSELLHDEKVNLILSYGSDHPDPKHGG